jgi:plastocyanin
MKLNRKAIGAIVAILALGIITGVAFAMRDDSQQNSVAGSDTVNGVNDATNEGTDGHQSQEDEDDGHQGRGRGRGGDDNTSANSATTPATTPVAVKQVAITDFAFSPASITVKKGDTVTWTNNDSVEHTVTREGSTGPDSALFDEGETFSYTFNTVGTFKYFCKPHPSMQGTVTVTE